MQPKSEKFSEKSKLLSDEFPILYENRYCDQEDFGIVTCGGWDYETNSTLKDVVELRNDNKTFIKLPLCSTMLEGRNRCKTAATGSDVYVIKDDATFRTNTSVDVLSGNIWKTLSSLLHHRGDYCLCSFMQQLFVIGGVKYGVCNARCGNRIRT